MTNPQNDNRALGNIRHLPKQPADFHPIPYLTANFTEVPNEIWDLQLPGLTTEIRWTLLFLARETIGRAFERGGSPYDFAIIPWERWMEALNLPSAGEVKERLARMEAMGLIEIPAGDPGSKDGQSIAYRLRWVNGGQPVPRTFHQVSRSKP